MKWQIFRDDSKFTTKDHEHEYQYWKFISEDLKWVFPLYARQGTGLHEILEDFTDDDISDFGDYLWSKDYSIEKYDSYGDNLKSSRQFSQRVLSDFVYGVDCKEEQHTMKGFIISSEGKCLGKIDFVDETNVYRAMLTLRMMTSSSPKQDSEYYVSAEDILPVTFYGEDSGKETYSKTDLVLAKSNSIEDALWFLEKCEEEYKGKRLSDCTVEEVYFGYNDELDSHGEIFKLGFDNGLVVSIREVYKL